MVLINFSAQKDQLLIIWVVNTDNFVLFTSLEAEPQFAFVINHKRINSRWNLRSSIFHKFESFSVRSILTHIIFNSFFDFSSIQFLLSDLSIIHSIPFDKVPVSYILVNHVINMFAGARDQILMLIFKHFVIRSEIVSSLSAISILVCFLILIQELINEELVVRLTIILVANELCYI